MTEIKKFFQKAFRNLRNERVYDSFTRVNEKEVKSQAMSYSKGGGIARYELALPAEELYFALRQVFSAKCKPDYYFVTYRRLNEVKNIILRNLHPIEWAKDYFEFYPILILWWKELSELPEYFLEDEEKIPLITKKEDYTKRCLYCYGKFKEGDEVTSLAPLWKAHFSCYEEYKGFPREKGYEDKYLIKTRHTA